MSLAHAAAMFLFFFAGAFALASLNHDLRAGWAAFKRLTKELNDDDA
jgi:hypothetical protein